jgi:hypothetical protein
MEEGPRDYNICPSCGTEFGLHDVNSGIEELRQVWLESGPTWFSKVIPQPREWKPMIQLAGLLMGQVQIQMRGSNPYGLGVSVFNAGAVDSAQASSYGLHELQCV